MKPWLQDVPDQLGLALLLARGCISCGERIGLIVADNAVEYMLVAYVESHRRLVGASRGISRKEWTEKKRYFEPLLDFVASLCPDLSNHRDDILNFHELRNSLYHTGQPVSVKEQKVRQYVNLARDVFNLLFRQNVTLDQLDQTALKNQAALAPDAAVKVSSRMVFERADGLVRLKTAAHVSNSDAICLVLYGFAREMSRVPSFVELTNSLARSGFTLTPRILSSRLYELRKRGLVSRSDLSLTSPGRRHVLDQFTID